MDREYSELLYGALFDELDRIQANKLYNEPELQKAAVDVRAIGQGIRTGFNRLRADPAAFSQQIQRSWGQKAPAGAKGILPRIGNVLKTPEGKMLGAGIVGAGALGALAAKIKDDREQGQQVIIQR